MELVFDVILPFLGEFLLPLLLELLGESFGGSDSDTVTEPLGSPKPPILAIFSLALWGTIAGGISLIVLPQSLIANRHLREIGLIAIPVSVSCVSMAIGCWRRRERQGRGPIARFGYPFTFSFAMSLVRFIGTQ
ncbi:hypothetical protein [Novosphingobium rosa]|uniref:hypothetical protein n=1 Tax=Novosphingobium rosa TaxID=76978 RepID=UPI00082A294A|nr:hypothetical protein [Novosphingobium rosa]